LFLAFKIIYWLCYYNLYFGESAIAFIRPFPIKSIKDLPFLLYNNTSTNSGYFYILGTIVFLTLSYFVKKIPFIFEFIVWFLVININNKIYPTLTGGDLLLNQFLFFNCFLSKSFTTNLSWQNALLKYSHNFGVLAIIIQIQLVYLIAGISKLNSADWLSGEAIQNLGQVNYFNLFSHSGATLGFSFIDQFINYVVLVYQLFFSVFIWIPKLKQPLILIGITMHLYIAFVIGLVSFGIIMLLAYVFFWPSKKQLS
jgi:hypothetical protein